MSAKISSATERALARIKAGETAYAAAKAEGIALSTIYRAIKRLNGLEKNYPYAVGKIASEIVGNNPE